MDSSAGTGTSLYCTSCGAPIEYDRVSLYVTCPFCNTVNEVTPEYVLQQHLDLLKDEGARERFMQGRFAVEKTIVPPHGFERPPFDLDGYLDDDAFLQAALRNHEEARKNSIMGPFIVPLLIFLMIGMPLVGALIPRYPYTSGAVVLVLAALWGLVHLLRRK